MDINQASNFISNITNIYKSGEKFINTRTLKTGTIKYLRTGEYEEKQRKTNQSHYYYHVDYDDGTFETYEYGEYLKPI